MAIYIGQTLLRQFRVDAFIGSGGMGAVYRVWDFKRNVPLAMKVLHADMAEDPSIFKRFKREARALQKLAHPNIVQFYGLQQTSELAFLLERFIDGPALKDILRQRKEKPLAVEETLVYLKALSSALGYAHAHGVVHCDVKPGNVMVDQGGNVYLTDFGIARHAESTTTTLGLAGTAAYMAPEQCRSEPVTAETDVYALGVILYEMLTGSRPFQGAERDTECEGATAAERIRYAHVHLSPPNPVELNPRLPDSLARVILRALAKNPGNRFRSTKDLFQAACASVGLDPEQVPDRVVVPTKLAKEVAKRASLQPAVSIGQEPATPIRTLKRALPWLEDRRSVMIFGGVGVLLLFVLIRILLPPGELPLVTPTVPAVVVMSETDKPLNASPTPRPAVVLPTPDQFATYAAQTVAARFTQSAIYTPTPVPGSLWKPDPNCPSSRIRVGNWTRVGLYPATSNRVRTKPNKQTGAVIGHAEPGVVLKVLDGPVCNNGMIWWLVRTQDESLEGWTSEGDWEGFWLDPGSTYPP